MPEPKAASPASAREVAQEICAQSQNVVQKVIAFNNDDVPQYLKNLHRFEKESRKARLVVK
jgi:hypothetical protein